MGKLEKYRPSMDCDVLNSWASDAQSLIDAQTEEIAGNEELISGMSDIMSKTADALKGPPPENTLHSTHDIAEVAAKQAEEIKRLRIACSLAHDYLFNQDIGGEVREYLEETLQESK